MHLANQNKNAFYYLCDRDEFWDQTELYCRILFSKQIQMIHFSTEFKN